MVGQTPDPTILLARFELLDNQYRSLRRMGIYALIFVVVMLVILTIAILQAKAGTGQGKGLVLRDENGRQRAGLIMVQGVPVLEFYDENGQVVAGLKMAKDERGL